MILLELSHTFKNNAIGYEVIIEKFNMMNGKDFRKLWAEVEWIDLENI